MANALYDKGRNAFLTGAINFTTDTIKAILVDTGLYAVNLNTNQFLSDVPVGARVATATLASKTAVDGVADAADTVFTAVTGASVEAVILFKDTGVEATSALIAYIDTGTGLPVTPNGGDITAQWSNGADKIFKL